MKGQCNCGCIKFEIDNLSPKFYQCHCSLCRKRGGSASNTATIVNYEKFHWISGVDKISTWVNNTGFWSDFCSKCGSPVPNPLNDPAYYWVPAGLLDNVKAEICAHLFLDSKASWDKVTPAKDNFNKEPDVTELVHLLNDNDHVYC